MGDSKCSLDECLRDFGVSILPILQVFSLDYAILRLGFLLIGLINLLRRVLGLKSMSVLDPLD